ncbi:MAG TPA: UvrD-helicase domain-containing protein [Bacteroidales bacterium]|nr:UvrD-helicase domain-containing protein [Bacteroidales bacterium]HNS46950.1 UvrD-helicase domain-containing protein [Bacteroidales bacterium]
MSFEVFSSSAGSGKTFTLVKEYLKIVLRDPAGFRHILAITFTNKAATEMKSRIVRSLTHLAETADESNENQKDALLSTLCSETSLSPELIRQRSRKALTLILHNYSDFAVSTIDSFVYRIMRTFAYDMQLPVDFDVELDTDRLIAKAVDLLVSKAGTDDRITRMLVGYTEFKASEEYHWQIEGDLQSFSENLMNEDGYDQVGFLRNLSLEDFFNLRNRLGGKIRKFDETLSGKARSILSLIASNEISQGAFYYKDRGFYGFVHRIALKNYENLTPGKFALETIEKGKWCSSDASDYERTAIQTIQSELLGHYREMMAFADKHKQSFVLFRLLYQHLYPLALLNEIEKIINELRQQTGSIHISEFNKRIAAIVMKEPVPFIYERLGEKFLHYLIDEFQDTSVLQWHNLLPLVDNSLASDHFNMIVGDPKQSIYRWRNGEVEQFIRLPKIYRRRDSTAEAERERTLERHYHPNALTINYRSAEEIIRFNNSFFQYTRNLLPANLMEIYKDVIQQPVAHHKGGYVQIGFFDQETTEEGFAPYNLRRVHEIIGEVTADHYSLSQIAILCRTNDRASALARYLLENGIQVISSESLLLKNSPEVVFLVSVMTFLNRPDALLEMALIRYLTDNDRIARNEWEAGLIRNVKGNNYVPQSFFGILKNNGFCFDPDMLVRLPVYELAEALLRCFSLDETKDPFIQFFLDAVLDFSANVGNGLREFLTWWEEKRDKLSIIAPQGSEAVQVMTIHKAKGLQFPVVIYPFADEGHRMTKHYTWLKLANPELAELPVAVLKLTGKLRDAGYADLYDDEQNKSYLDMVNLLYVVMTRASQRLYIVTIKPPTKAEKFLSVPELFHTYLESIGGLQDGVASFETGEKIPSSSGKAGDEQAKGFYSPEFSLISNDWRQNAQLTFQAAEAWDAENPDRNREWGKLVHRIFSSIITPADVPAITSSLLTSGLVTTDQKVQLEKMISGIISHPLIRDFFCGDLITKTETEILLPSGRSYRPDRLLLKDEKAIVIDYKTGLPSEEHQKQLRFYGGLLHDMGYPAVEKYLIYLNEEISLVKVN